MRNSRSSIEKAFKNAMVILFVFTFALVITIFNRDTNSSIYGILVGLSIIIAGIIGIIGSIQVIKGLKEQKSIKMVFAILFNFGIVFLFIGLLTANAIDIIKLFH